MADALDARSLSAKRHLVALALATAAMTAGGGEDRATPDQDNFFKRAAKVIGQDARTATRGAKQAGKDVAHGAAKAGKDVGQLFKPSPDKTGKQAKTPSK